MPLTSQVTYLSSSEPVFILDPDHGTTFATLPTNQNITTNATSFGLDKVSSAIETITVSKDGTV